MTGSHGRLPYAAGVSERAQGAEGDAEPERAGVAAYVILSHRDPEQVLRLVRAIRASSPDAQVFVSHDARGCPQPEIDDPRVHVRAHGRATDWGSFEILLVTLEAFAWARETADPDMVILVSGQDYPARPLVDWERAFLERGGWAGVVRPLRYRPRWGRGDEGGFDRALLWYAYRWFPLPPVLSTRVPEPLRTQWYRLLHGVLKRTEPALAYHFLRRGRGPYIGVPRRPVLFSGDRPCYKGSQWMALDRTRLDIVLEQAVPGGELFDAFRHALIPDEAFLQTLLSWATPVQEDSAVSYLDWPEDVRAESPRTLGLGDLPAIVSSGSPFCRKVDGNDPTGLLAALDRLNRPGPRPPSGARPSHP